MENNRLIESNEILEEIILILTEMADHLKNKKKYLVNLLKKWLLSLII